MPRSASPATKSRSRTKAGPPAPVVHRIGSDEVLRPLHSVDDLGPQLRGTALREAVLEGIADGRRVYLVRTAEGREAVLVTNTPAGPAGGPDAA